MLKYKLTRPTGEIGTIEFDEDRDDEILLIKLNWGVADQFLPVKGSREELIQGMRDLGIKVEALQ